MTKKAPQYVTKTTPDPTQAQIERLKNLFPECVSEGRIDFDLLRAILGSRDALTAQEAYSFTWAGKQYAFRAIQTPSAASLMPVPDESINWDTTRHIFIEGENLEVLKLLYKSYFGRVKMIYIDPPYNTGNDFVYRDDYSEPRRAYLEKTGQVDAEGNVLTSNPETSGRYHSAWLSMMYPRLFLARQLLREDGVIFASIDYHELYHLRILMNEIFGEENYIGTIIWKGATDNNPTQIAIEHEYMLCFARNKVCVSTPWKNSAADAKMTMLHEYERLRRIHSQSTELIQEEFRRFIKLNQESLSPITHYSLVDDKGPYTGGRKVHNPRPGGYEYDVIHPVTGRTCVPPANGYRYPEQRMAELIREGRILFGDDETQIIQIKEYLADYEGKLSSVIHLDSRAGSNELAALLGRRKIFDNPKPAVLLRQVFDFCVGIDDLVLDFFAGSCTAAQAVLELNQHDGGNRRFIMIQLPEPTPADSIARKAGYETVSDVGKERIRRVIAKLQNDEQHGQLSLDLQSEEDLGFKVFKLAPSTFRHWEPPEGDDPDALQHQLSYFDHGLAEGADPNHVIYEVILKEGFSLNARIEPLDVETNHVYRVSEPEDTEEARFFYICLDNRIQDATLNAVSLDKETIFVCLDTALDDSQKVNLAIQCLLKVI